MHLHFHTLTIKDWYGPGKDLKLSVEPGEFWKKTLMSSGIDPSLIALCKNDGPIQVPKKPTLTLSESEVKLMTANPALDF
jgi:hypothetical protein